MSTKPYASLSNQDVLDIINEIDKEIESAQSTKEAFENDTKAYAVYLAQEIAFLKVRNLILSKV